MRLNLCVLVAAALFAFESEARADAADLMPPGTRPMWFAIGVGPSFYGLNLGRGRPGGPRRGRNLRTVGRGKLAFDFGYHFSGDSEGAAIGATIEQTIDDFFYVFNPGFKFWYDIHITDYAIYITPQAKAGYALGVCDPCRNAHAFNLAVGVEGRVIFKDRWLTFLRPVQVDTYLGDFFGETFVINYDVLIGGGVTF
jgi:hypothetical protein